MWMVQSLAVFIFHISPFPGIFFNFSVNIFHMYFIISIIFIAGRAQPAFIWLKIGMSQQMSLVMNLHVHNFKTYLTRKLLNPYFMFSLDVMTQTLSCKRFEVAHITWVLFLGAGVFSFHVIRESWFCAKTSATHGATWLNWSWNRATEWRLKIWKVSKNLNSLVGPTFPFEYIEEKLQKICFSSYVPQMEDGSIPGG